MANSVARAKYWMTGTRGRQSSNVNSVDRTAVPDATEGAARTRGRRLTGNSTVVCQILLRCAAGRPVDPSASLDGPRGVPTRGTDIGQR